MRKFYSFALILSAMLCGFTSRAWADETLTVDGSITAYLPIYGTWADANQHNQCIIPASKLTEMQGSAITSMKFYSKTATAKCAPTVTVKLANLPSSSNLSSGLYSGDMTEVWSGTFSLSSSIWTIDNFSGSFVYGDGDLLIDFTTTTDGNYNSYLTFYGFTNTSGGRYSYNSTNTLKDEVPKVTFTYAAAALVSCPKPTSLTGTPASSTSATITWKRKGSETAWDLQYSDDNFTTHTELNLTTSEVDVDGSDNCSYTLIGLEPLTSYKIKVQANCGVDDVSDYTSTSSFTTPCPEENLPFYENFNCLSSGVPEYWDNSQGDMTGQHDSYKWNYFATGHTGACVRFNSYNTSSGKYNYLCTRAIKIHEATTFSFWYKNPTGGDFSVSYKINGGSETPLVTGLTGKSSWTQYTYNFSAQDAEKNIVFIFKATSNYGSGDAYIYLDDVSLSRTSCSSQPSGLTASSVDGNSAQLSWTSSGSTWGMRYRANCGDWVEINNLTSKTYSLTGLEPTTDYEVQVKTVCGVDEESAWSESATFRTTCGAISALPWSYGFEGVTTSPASIPECWGRTPDDTNIGAVAGNVRTGSRAMKLYGGTKSTVRTLVLPEFSASFSSLKIEFYYKMDFTNASYGSPIIGYINTDGTFKGLDTLTQYNSYTKAEYTFPSSYEDTPAKIAIRFAEGEDNNNYRRNLYIDDITVSSIMQCEQPLSVMASNILDITARVSWSARPGITSYQYCVVGEDEDPDWSGNLTTETNSVDLSGLTASTTYDFYVRCVCGVGEYSDVSAVCQFTTLAGCPTPGTVEKSNQTACGVTLTWTAGGGETGWNVHYKAGGGSYGDPIHVTSPTYNLTGLTVGTTYYYQVQADCEGEWTTVGAYTPLCPTPGTPTFSNQTYNSATVTWAAGNCEESWNLRYQAGSGAWTYANGLTSRTYNLTSLTAGTTYTVEVQSACQANWSTGVASNTYTPVCPQPGAITLSGQTYKGVIVSWAKGGTEDSWNVRYKETAAENIPANWTNVASATTNRTCTIASGLTSGTEYTIEVTAACCEGGAARTITYTPSCAQPGTITLSSKTYNSVVVGWAASGTIDSWNLQYKAAGDANWTDVAMNTTSRSGHSISGLTTGTTYTIRVTAACCTADARETTYTPAYTAPNQPSAGSLTETTARITWSAVSDATGYQYILVAANAAADWTSPTTATSPLDLSGLTPGTSYDVYVRSVYPTGYSAASTKRNFTTTTVAPSITGASPTELTSSSATFAWTKSGYTTDVKYQWKIGSGSWSDPISATSVTVDGLSANTSYTFYVRTYYGASVQSGNASKSFTTECAEIEVDAEHPWTYGFEDVTTGYSVYNIPDCWSRERSGYSASPTGTYPYVSNYSYKTGSKSMVFGGGYTYGKCDAILPHFDVALSDLVLTFYYTNQSGYTTSEDPEFEAGYYTTSGDASTFVSLGKLTRIASWTKAEYNLADVPAAAKDLVIRFGGGTGYNSTSAYIDDIEVKFSTGCSKPANPTCSSYTSTTATIAWTDYKAASAWQIEYSENDDFSAPTTIVDADSNPFTLTGLRSNTQYYARVKTICGADDESEWSVRSASFRTDCGTHLSDDMPWTFDFESNTEVGDHAIPYCWTRVSYYDDYLDRTYPHVSDLSGRSGNCLEFADGTSTSTVYVTLPELEDNLSDLTIEFYYKGSTDATAAQFSVGYMTDPEDGSTFTACTTLDKVAAYTKATVDLKDIPASAHRISIKWGGGSLGTRGFIDDIIVHPTALVFTDADGDSDWTNEDNWMMGAVPTIDDAVVIRKPSVIPAGETALAKSVVLDYLTGHNGTIDIEPTGALVIADTLRKMTGTTVRAAKTYGPTTENDLSISTSADGNGVLAIGSHDGTNRATVNFYTKACKTDADGWINQFIGTPFGGSTGVSNDVMSDYYGSYIYKFDAESQSWVNQKRGTSSVAFAGYNILRKDAAPSTLWMQGALNASNASDKELTLTYNGENTTNIIANSWMAPIDIASMTGAFTNCEATVYLYNAGSKSQAGATEFDTGSADADNTSPGQFIALPVASAPWVSPAITVIPSMQAFLVVATAANPKVTLNYSTMVLTPLQSMANAKATAGNRAPRRNVELNDAKPDIMRLHVAGMSGGTDIVYLLMREDFTTDFDNGYDGRKMLGDDANPQLYALSDAGDMAISCIPDAEGTVLAFRRGSETDYRMTFAYDGWEVLYLNDLKTNESVIISELNDYRFTATEDEPVNRFVISATPIRYVPTDIDNSGAISTALKAKKVIINDHLYIIKGNNTFSVTGVMMK